MNFDYGEILKKAAQITWRHKSFWVLMILQMLPVILIFPFLFLSVFFLENNGGRMEGIYVIVAGVIFFLIFISSFFIAAYSHSATTLGIIRVDRGDGNTGLMDLMRDALPVYARSLGLFLSIQLTIGLVFTIIFMFIGALSLVTMGIGAICAQPIILLLTPFSLLFMAYMEAAQTALLAENLGVADALKRAFQIVREHVWKYLLIALIVFLGANMITSMVSVPLILPIFFVTAFMESSSQSSAQMGLVVMFSMLCVFMPVVAALSSVTQVFTKAALDLSYLRLTRPAPVTAEVIHLEEPA